MFYYYCRQLLLSYHSRLRKKITKAVYTVTIYILRFLFSQVSLRCVDSLLKTGGLNFEAISDDLFTVVISCLQDITPGANESAR